jgi:D-glycero-beta-D-manno-heptose-7-phosphate kinase
MSQTHSKDDLNRVLGQMKGCKVLVVGDPVLDVYLYGTTVRISREAPIPIVRQDDTENRLGGAANAAANLAALGAHTSLVGFLGDDQSADTLTETAQSLGIDTSGLVRLENRHTITKTRILAGGLHTTKQQLLRLDQENKQAPNGDSVGRLLDVARDQIAAADAVIISDYGAFTDGCVRVAEAAVKMNKRVIVDSRYALQRFAGTFAVTPNEPEVEAALGIKLDSGPEAVAAAEQVLNELNLGAVLLTRGREGMAIAQKGQPSVLLNAHGAKDAVDVTGAGDTVTATFTLAQACGAGVIESAVLANCAAALVVQVVGAATVKLDDIASALEDFDPASIKTA